MSKIAIYTEIDTHSLMNGIASLKINELEEMVKSLNLLISQKRSKLATQQESKLLLLHNKTFFSSSKQQLLSQLTNKLEEESISEIERTQLQNLLDEAEKLRNKRLRYLIELAQIKNTSLPLLMQGMGLKPHGI